MQIPIPAYEGPESYVFVCYAHSDAAVVHAEIAHLQAAGVRVWYDEGIPGGLEWSESLAEHIENCAGFLFFVSPSSVLSAHCHREVSYSLDRSRAVIPVHIDPTELPKGLQLSLGNRQAILKYEYSEQHYRDRLLNALLPMAARSAEPPQLSQRQTVTGQSISRPQRETRPSIAVLAFANMSSDPEQEFFSDGIAEDILNRLAQIPRLIVKARTSAFSFKGQNTDVRTIGTLLGVTHLLEGSVRKVGSRVRITTQLVATGEDVHVWSAQYDRELDDVFAVQDEISRAVLNALNVHLLGAPEHRLRTISTPAYNAYLLGRHHINHMNVGAAIESFERAIALVPDYADAHAALAAAHFSTTGLETIPVSTKLGLVRDHIAHALQTDPQHVMARQVRASINFMIDHQYQAAIDECAALARHNPVSPMDGYATILRSIGRSDLSLELSVRTLELDPLSSVAHRNRAMYLRDLGRYDEAAEAIEQASQLGLWVQNELATLALERQDERALATHVESLRALFGEQSWIYLVHKSGLHYLRSEHAAVREILAGVEASATYQPSFFKWGLAICANDIDRAVRFYANALLDHEHLAYTWSQGSAGMRRLFPAFYGSDARQRILAQVGLDSQSIARLAVPTLAAP